MGNVQTEFMQLKVCNFSIRTRIIARLSGGKDGKLIAFRITDRTLPERLQGHD